MGIPGEEAELRQIKQAELDSKARAARKIEALAQAEKIRREKNPWLYGFKNPFVNGIYTFFKIIVGTNLVGWTLVGLFRLIR